MRLFSSFSRRAKVLLIKLYKLLGWTVPIIIEFKLSAGGCYGEVQQTGTLLRQTDQASITQPFKQPSVYGLTIANLLSDYSYAVFEVGEVASKRRISMSAWRFRLSSVRFTRKFSFLLLLLVLLVGAPISYLLATHVLPYVNLVPLTFSQQELRDDFTFLRKTLEEGHPGLYRYTSKTNIDRLFDETLQKLDRPMGEAEFFRVVAPVIASIKDGHTTLESATVVSDLLVSEKIFPFSVRILGGKVFIFDDFATPDHTLAGAEIISLNDVPAGTILQTMMADTPGDGNISTGKTELIGRGTGAGFFRALFSPMLSPWLGIKSPFTVKYRLPQQTEERTIQVSGQSFNDLVKTYEKKYPSEARPPLLPDGQIKPPDEPQFLDNGNIAVWKFPGFGGYTSEDRNGAFIDKGFQQIRSHGSSTLILDVRLNSGGLDALGARLFSYFADEPFQYYDDLVANALTFSFAAHTGQDQLLPTDEFVQSTDGKYHWVKHPNWGILQPREPHFVGKVYVLISGVCFSTCAEFVSTMHFHKKAIFVGEEIGGAYDGNTSGFDYQVFLPHTKIVLHMPVVAYYLSVHDYPNPDHGVTPDYSVQSTIDDLLAGKDNEMTLALSLARGGHP